MYTSTRTQKSPEEKNELACKMSTPQWAQTRTQRPKLSTTNQTGFTSTANSGEVLKQFRKPNSSYQLHEINMILSMYFHSLNESVGKLQRKGITIYDDKKMSKQLLKHIIGTSEVASMALKETTLSECFQWCLIRKHRLFLNWQKVPPRDTFLIHGNNLLARPCVDYCRSFWIWFSI